MQAQARPLGTSAEMEVRHMVGLIAAIINLVAEILLVPSLGPGTGKPVKQQSF